MVNCALGVCVEEKLDEEKGWVKRERVRIRTENVLVDDESRALRLAFSAYADLADGAILAEDFVEILGADLVREVAHVEDSVHLRR